MGNLSTHVLDTMHGKPAPGVRIRLYRFENSGSTLLKTTFTNADGRCSEPLLQGREMQPGRYELVFSAGDYFAALGVAAADPRFLDDIPVRFGIADTALFVTTTTAAIDESYHVPLVMTPWTYAAYRGS